MVKNIMESPNIEFREALKFHIKNKWKGKQKELARKAEVSSSFLSMVLKGRKVASAAVQHKIAKALKVQYQEMISLGKDLINESSDIEYSIEIKDLEDRAEKLFEESNEIDEPKIIECRQHEDIIKLFKNKELAREINQLLLKVENIDPERLEEIREYLELIYKRLSKKNDLASSA